MLAVARLSSLSAKDDTTYQYNELHETFATHQNSNSKTFSPHQLISSSCKCTTDDLSRKCNSNDSNYICPGDTIVQETKICAQPRECKVERQENDRNEIFDLFRELDGESTIMRADKPNKES